ncbi:MAG: YceI family protein [Opitutaceae bacterium]
MLPSLAVFHFLVAAAGLWAGPTYQAAADIRFRGTSTLHDFEGSMPPPVFSVRLSDRTTGQSDLAVSAEISVLAAELTTHHEKRDMNMHRMLDLVHFPVIKVSVADARIPESGNGEISLLLRIRDRTETILARISDWHEDSGGVSFLLDFPVSLKTFGLRPPSLLGVIRVGDEVVVTCDVHPPIENQVAGLVGKSG